MVYFHTNSFFIALPTKMSDLCHVASLTILSKFELFCLSGTNNGGHLSVIIKCSKPNVIMPNLCDVCFLLPFQLGTHGDNLKFNDCNHLRTFVSLCHPSIALGISSLLFVYHNKHNCTLELVTADKLLYFLHTRVL